MEAQLGWGGRGKSYPYSFCNLGDRWWWAVNATPRPVYPPERDPVAYPLYRGLSGPKSRFERVRQISLPPRFDSPDRLVRSESLHRLSYWYLATYSVSIYVSCLNKKYLTITGKYINGNWQARHDRVHIVVLYVVKYASLTSCYRAS